MISEGFCDTKDTVLAAEISALHHRNKLHFNILYIQIFFILIFYNITVLFT